MGYLQPGIDQWRYRPRGARSPVSAEPKLQEGKERRKLGEVVVVRRRRGTSGRHFWGRGIRRRISAS